MRGLLKILAGFALLVCLSATCVLSAPNSQENDVQNFVSEFATAWNNHDMDALGKLFAPDADFVNVAGSLWRGRQSIQAQHAYTHGVIPADSPGFTEADRPYHGIFKNSTMKFNQVDVRFLRKDVAIAHVSWELLGDARTQGARDGVFLFVLARQNPRWLIAAAQNTEINRTVK
jgi:ketosteroid isomerase-like protein